VCFVLAGVVPGPLARDESGDIVRAKTRVYCLSVVLSRLLGVPIWIRLVWILGEKPLATTIPIHGRHR